MQTLQWRAVLNAAAIGALIIVIWSFLQQLLVGDLSELQAALLDPSSAALSPELEQLSQRSLLFGMLGYVITGTTWIGTGVLYAFFHKQVDAITLNAGAVGGAVAGVIGSIIGSLITTFLQRDQLMSLLDSILPALPADFPLNSLIAFSAVCGAVCGSAIGAILGAIGGAVGGSVWNDVGDET